MTQAPNEQKPDQDSQPQEPYYHYPGATQQPQRQGGMGCWLVGLLSIVIATVLIVVGLFLPPIKLGDRLFNNDPFAMFDPQMAAPGSLLAVEESGLTLLVNPVDLTDEFGVALSSLPGESLLTSGSDGVWIQAASAARPIYLIPQSTIYSIETTGIPPVQITLTVTIPSDAAAIDVLDLYEWNPARNAWDFVPAHPTADRTALRADLDHVPQHLTLFQTTPINTGGEPTLMTVLDVGDQITGEVLSKMDIVSPTGRQPALIPATATEAARATLVGLLAPGYQTDGGYKVMPVVRNFSDPRAIDDTVITIISDPSLRSQHIQQLADFANASRFDGLFIDYRDIPAEQRSQFSVFIQQLSSRLETLDIDLGVVIPGAEGVVVASDDEQTANADWQTDGYDWRAIGRHADYVVINFGLNPAQFTPGDGQLVEEMMTWAVGEISRYKILGGLTARSVQQRGGTFTPIGFDEALSPLGNVRLEAERSEAGTIIPGSEIRLGLDGFAAVPGTDDTIQTPYIIYNDATGSEASRMWLTTHDALLFRISRLGSFGILGVAFNDLLALGVTQDIHTALDSSVETSGPSELVLNWQIESARGQVAQLTSRLNEPVVVTLDAEEGNYAVNVAVVSGDASSSRGGAEVALALPTITPTLRPTSTPTPTPTATPTLGPVQSNPTPSSSGSTTGGSTSGGTVNTGPPVVNPGAGSIGALEIGGHVTGTGSSRAQGAMQAAGMTWMKVQVRFSPGADISYAAEQIRLGHAAGFKILIGVVGSPNQIGDNLEDYSRQFGEYVGRLATQSPDAIEVWNEPNIAREWPEGRINGSNYTTLLRAAYNGIKSSNPGVMVISAALAPTGAEPAFPGQVVNDDNFLRQMVQAGALNFMDCVGMHYNEGIVSAYATSGDPRDNYYTRYLPTMINYYWDIVGGNRPICITELGYLTSDGYGSLPDFFSWAAGNTVAEQAAWLAEAAAFSSQSGKVRLMIVWNIDFEIYGADPMAGYAIIRADGSCPACNALAGAR